MNEDFEKWLNEFNALKYEQQLEQVKLNKDVKEIVKYGREKRKRK